jgi:hypothetical protein
MEGGGGGVGGFILLASAACLLFRPADAWVSARGFGRVVGFSLRAARKARAAAVAAAASAEATAGGSSARARVARSVRAVDDIARRLRREVAPLRFDPRRFAANPDPAAPAAGVRAAAAAGGGAAAAVPAAAAAAAGGSGAGMAAVVRMRAERPAVEGVRLRGVDAGERNVSGSDVVSAVIEEAAFAAMQARVVGGEVAVSADRDGGARDGGARGG